MELTMDPHDVSATSGSDYKLSRSTSNIFEYLLGDAALDAHLEFRNQVRRRRKSAGCCEQGTGRLSVSYQIAVSARPQ